MKNIKRLDEKKTPQVTSEQKKTKPYSDPWGMGFRDEKQERKYLYGLLLVICLIWIPPFFLAAVDEELFLRYSPLMKGPLPGNISLLPKNSLNPVPCPTWC